MQISQQKNAKANPVSQRGAAPIIGIVIIVVLVLVALLVAFLALTNSKQSATLQANPIQVKPDDPLTQGKTNNELVIDQKIIKAGLDRDEQQRQAAETALNDQPNDIGSGTGVDNAGTTVQDNSLSGLQAQYIAEVDRRLDLLDKTNKLAQQLDPSQKPTVTKTIGDESTALTGLKAKAAAETTQDGFKADSDALDKEYLTFLLAYAQTNLLLWANNQTVLDAKANVLGGKFQERLNDASNNGQSVADAQTQLNSYQANKSQAVSQTADALKATFAVKVGSYESNRAVLKTYYDKLSSSHGQINNALATATTITLAISKYK